MLVIWLGQAACLSHSAAPRAGAVSWSQSKKDAISGHEGRHEAVGCWHQSDHFSEFSGQGFCLSHPVQAISMQQVGMASFPTCAHVWMLCCIICPKPGLPGPAAVTQAHPDSYTAGLAWSVWPRANGAALQHYGHVLHVIWHVCDNTPMTESNVYWWNTSVLQWHMTDV